MQVKEYLVTLCVRRAELVGLKQLPGLTKDALTPLLLLAPWLSTSPLTRSLDKFEDAFSNRPYFVDVDTYYQVNENGNEAKEYWERIAHKPADIEAWWALLENYPNASPCLLMANQTIENVREQITWAREHNRTFCIRLNLAQENGSGIPLWLPTLIDELVNDGANDFIIVLEFGLVDDPLMVGAIAAGHIQVYLPSLSPDIFIAISCTSFPSDFTIYDGLCERTFTNRELINQIRRATNHPLILYGDWGSTKPRSYGHASAPKTRIDYPTKTSWAIARGQDEEITLQTAAKMIVESKYWNGASGIWGEQQIQDTADGQAYAIKSMPNMYAARINIHLHRQAFYDNLPAPEALDEEWNDEEF